jgi:hypothetical protein
MADQKRFRTAFSPPSCFRVCSGDIQHPKCPIGIDRNWTICPRGEGLCPTLDQARKHLSWVHSPTPFTSLFNTYKRALRKALTLQRAGLQDVYIVVIDTYHVQAGELLEAFDIATAVGFTWRDPNRRRRLENHVGEYLFVGRIRSERILAVVPAMGAVSRITVHLGELGMPQSFLAGVVPAAGEALEEAVKREIEMDIYMREGVVNEVKVQQIMRALCLATWD